MKVSDKRKLTAAKPCSFGRDYRAFLLKLNSEFLSQRESNYLNLVGFLKRYSHCLYVRYFSHNLAVNATSVQCLSQA